MKIAIVGAGIGGLTVAALLEEQGHQVKFLIPFAKSWLCNF
jgi:2-polyprenyl-6-methoxyphenol hydroxylase-like FAD-dependent oxidoreductase